MPKPKKPSNANSSGPTTGEPGDSQSAPATPKKSALQRFLNTVFTADSDDAFQQRREAARNYVIDGLENYKVAEKYNVLVLFDSDTLLRADADALYTALRGFPDQDKDILLVLYSMGGMVEPAYFIGKMCHTSSKNRFVVAVPRQAKSAATLICCAADELHMGSLSELGPIDPQINGVPALGLGNAVRHITQLAAEFPDASQMLADYLARAVRPVNLGYYERVAESASQYAERLLGHRRTGQNINPSVTAHRLVYDYKDHGFVIDRSEASELFGEDVVKSETDEYLLANRLYDRLSFVSWVCRDRKWKFYWVGNLETNPTISKKRPPTTTD